MNRNSIIWLITACLFLASAIIGIYLEQVKGRGPFDNKPATFLILLQAILFGFSLTQAFS